MPLSSVRRSGRSARLASLLSLLAPAGASGPLSTRRGGGPELCCFAPLLLRLGLVAHTPRGVGGQLRGHPESVSVETGVERVRLVVWRDRVHNVRIQYYAVPISGSTAPTRREKPH